MFRLTRTVGDRSPSFTLIFSYPCFLEREAKADDAAKKEGEPKKDHKEGEHKHDHKEGEHKHDDHKNEGLNSNNFLLNSKLTELQLQNTQLPHNSLNVAFSALALKRAYHELIMS